MIRTSTINLNYSTDFKKQELDLLIHEFRRVVNIFIDHHWQFPKLSKFKDSFTPDTWLSSRMVQLAHKTAMENIKSVRKKDRDLSYKRYKKVYKYFKKKERFSNFTNKRFGELNLKFRIKPVYHKDTITFDSRFIEYIEDMNSFDIWVKLNSLGRKIKLLLPSKKHKHFNMLKSKGFDIKQSGRLRKVDDNYYFDIFFEKETPKLKDGDKVLAIDLGINKLMTMSDGSIYGKEFKDILIKMRRKKYGSKRYLKKIQELKNFIGRGLNQIGYDDIDAIVIEDLKNISKSTRGKLNKTTRQYLSRWNYGLFRESLSDKCEENGVLLAHIDPKYTSRTCLKCNHVDKGNRSGECFKCLKCGFEEDADIVGAKNILRRFHQDFIVPDPVESGECNVC